MRRAKPEARSDDRRRGVAAAETAVMLPVLLLLVFGSIELANGVYLKQTLTLAAYEGVRSASWPGATNADAHTRIADVLAARSVTDYEVEITPEVTLTTERATEITVRVSAPGSTYSLGLPRLFDEVFLYGEACMVRQ
jgi:Flp pilus assembly protein TadG